MTDFESGIDEGLLRALGIVTSEPDQTIAGCARAIRNEMDRRTAAIRSLQESAADPRIDSARRHLINLQPHIAQLPKQYQPFVDAHIDMALSALNEPAGAQEADVALPGLELAEGLCGRLAARWDNNGNQNHADAAYECKYAICAEIERRKK